MIRLTMAKRVSSNRAMDLALRSRHETESFGRAVGRMLRGGEVLALIGELGAGKTALVRGMAAALGAPETAVSSPTFILIQQYRGRLPLIHIDLYRLRTAVEAESIGLADCFSDETITVIEWADRFPSLLPTDRLELRLTHRTPTTRSMQLAADGPQSRSLLGRIEAAWSSPKRRGLSRQSKTSARRKAL